MGGIDCALNISSTSVSVNSISAFLWVSEPAFRGTFGIIWLCLSTITICVWSSLHLDILAEPLPSVKSIFDAVAWVVAALLFPELIFFYAAGQRASAKHLRNRYRELQVVTHEYPFTIVHGFYATMGGYWFSVPALEGDQVNGEPERPVKSRFRITPLGIQFLLEHDIDLIPDLSEKSITCRSHSGSLGKALLIFQVFRFCLNCGSRFGRHLPLSLLEVMTAAHGVCTLATYFVWWSKPQNIDEPTLILHRNTGTPRPAPLGEPASAPPPDAREVCALMRMLSLDDLRNQLRAAISLNVPVRPRVVETLDASNPSLLDLALKAANHYQLTTPEIFDDLMTETLHGVHPPYYVLEAKTSSLKYTFLHFRHTLRAIKCNFDSASSVMGSSMIIGTVTSAYGAIHFFAWHAQFPTPNLQFLWRLACIVSTVSGWGVRFYCESTIQSPVKFFVHRNRRLQNFVNKISNHMWLWSLHIMEAIIDRILVQNKSGQPRWKFEAAREILRKILRNFGYSMTEQVVVLYENVQKYVRIFLGTVAWCIVVLLIPSVLFIVGESIHQLFFLPPEAYAEPSWYTFFQSL